MTKGMIYLANNKGLGRGLGALLGDSFDETPENSPYKLLPIYKVEPNASQPRQDFDEEELEALSESIQVHGVIQPSVVRSSAAVQKHRHSRLQVCRWTGCPHRSVCPGR